VEFSITTADKYFKKFEKNDIGILWFSPDERSFYDYYSAFDCSARGSCYFNWHDAELEQLVRRLHISTSSQEDKKTALAVERVLLRRGYAAPIAEMNWWIKSAHGLEPVHPSGLGQIRFGDFF
jgi:hypothetical protein